MQAFDSIICSGIRKLEVVRDYTIQEFYNERQKFFAYQRFRNGVISGTVSYLIFIVTLKGKSSSVNMVFLSQNEHVLGLLTCLKAESNEDES